MERTAYNYGDDTPAAWDVLARGALGRPISTRISPVLFLEELNEALLFAPPVKARLGQRPKPAGPGKTKALAASSVERPEETERRRAAQNDCRRLILPRTADEASDVFLRRLDAHQNAPEALVAPLSKPEDTKSFLRRMVAVKKNEAAGLLVMPRAKAETAEQFEARMALCEACPATVFARGAHEDPTDFKARLDAQSKCRRPIMCRSDGEPASLFRRRCAVSRACLDVVHPYDAARESADDFTRRMDAQEAAPELSIAPGDKKVVGSLVRESAEEGAAALAEEIAAKLRLEEEAKAAAASKEEAAKAEAAAISKQRQRQDSVDDGAEARSTSIRSGSWRSSRCSSPRACRPTPSRCQTSSCSRRLRRSTASTSSGAEQARAKRDPKMHPSQAYLPPASPSVCGGGARGGAAFSLECAHAERP
ncbi:hypothetical protein EMIHUDRAFT_438095 [Emiliania huxleyi CCMP1516]|uniref:Uncharacterized protein n=2 Tax=Emiliania huxleyi TaxID=2903 RepID=A0A0D3ID92_EMIH1|nr:hypothetical protein EMIHUDRAFT_438095 [Emiliania huxleyi CCMP1516]EOD09227.1 hypothetical protein EMIHUDRAFT_438095 [Emiliania huxleyi CCMP1516]|eukprot:XP_005761656.1 hypothetical protein EMIHUDRAFT_438095 [Emiliania huxleyi CCMP1516]